MKNIFLPIAIFTLFFASCQGGQKTETPNATSEQAVEESSPQILVSQIDISAEYFGDNSVTLRYDSDNRLVEMDLTELEGVVKIDYSEDLVTVEAPMSSTRYTLDGNIIIETVISEENGETMTEYHLENGKVVTSSSKFDDQVTNNKTYIWNGDLLVEETKEEFLDGEEKKSTTQFKYGSVKNYFNIDLLGLATSYNLDEPKVGSLSEGFCSALLPDEVMWEGELGDGIKCQKTTRYEYTFSGERITEIVITEKSIVYETEDPYIWSSSETIRVNYY